MTNALRSKHAASALDDGPGMTPKSNMEGRAMTLKPFEERFVWLSDEYSVHASTLCLHRPESPNADFFCLAAKGHRGKHQHVLSPKFTDHSHREAAHDHP